MSVIAGSSRYLTCVEQARTRPPHCAVTGSQPSQIAKTRMRTIPVTKSGIAASEMPDDRDRLVGQPCRSGAPAITPPRIESGTQMTKATNASFNELGSAGPSRSQAGTCFVSDIPRSPWRSPPAQSMYWTTSEPVRAELLVERVDRLLRRERPEHGTADVAREDRRDGEDDHAEQEQRDQREADALEEEAGHRRVGVGDERAGRPRRGRRPLVACS